MEEVRTEGTASAIASDPGPDGRRALSRTRRRVSGGLGSEEGKAVDHRGLRSVGARAITTTRYNTTRHSRDSVQLGKVFRN
jgi:hypothetical protein